MGRHIQTRGAKEFLALVLLAVEEGAPLVASELLRLRGATLCDLGVQTAVSWYRRELLRQEKVLREAGEVEREVRHG